MRLPDFIAGNLEPILIEWETFAREVWPGTATDPATLRDDAEEMLRATVADMGANQNGDQQRAKSKGAPGDSANAVRINRVSAAHGASRMHSGFDLTTLIAEYRALRASVIRLWRESMPSADLNDLNDITRFNEAIDHALTDAVIAYSRLVERDRAAALREQTGRSQELRELNDKLLVSSVRQHELTEQAERALAALGEAKEQAESANRAKDTFLAVLSHELRTPLTPVVMTISAFEIDQDMPFKFRDDLAMVRRNIDLEVKLIDDLLDLSRITSGKLRLQLQDVRVHELLTHVLRSSVSETHAKRLHVRTEFQASNDRLSADPGRLQQVFWNLVRNAVKFTPEGGEVVVRTWNAQANTTVNTPENRPENAPENALLIVEVRDTGIGIDPDVLPRIFDAFQQGEAGVTRQFGGLGLGLAIARAVTELHGGTITAASAGRNRGAAFTLALRTEKTADLPRASDDHASHSLPPQPQARIRVLLVEDHADTVRVMAKLLRDSGHEVTTANTAASALQAARDQPFDIVVSDIGLPDATGFDLMKQVRDRHGLKGIALSGYGMEDDLRMSRASGFFEHLVKPVNVAQLEEVIKRVISNDHRQW